MVLREQVKEFLLQRIISGEYRSGDRLVETRIAREVGTSQGPVREALRELESLRFVTYEPFRGARVRGITEKELAEIYPVRAALEETAAQEAATRLGGEVEALEAEIDAMLCAVEEGDLAERVRHDVRFHQLIVEASGNQILLEVWKSLRIDARTMITAIWVDLDPLEIVDMHRPIVEVLAKQDPGEAGRVVRHHLEVFGEMLTREIVTKGESL